MKSNFVRFLPFIILCSMLQWGCDNEIDVIGEWKEIPIVYGVFTNFPQGTTNYYRIEKAFLDPTTDAFVVAQRPDSLYYGENEIEVILYERVVGPGYPDAFVAIDTLVRVDAATLGFQREEGVFAGSPNYIYVSDAVSNSNDYFRYYQLVINNKVTGKTFTQNCMGIKPGNYDYTELSFPNFKVVNPSRSTLIRWVHISPTTGQWIFDDVTFTSFLPYPASIYDLSLIIGYFEFEVDPNQPGEPEIPGTRVYKELTWKPVRNAIGDGEVVKVERFGAYFYEFTNPTTPQSDYETVRNELRGENFYNYLKNNLSDVSNTNIRRCMKLTYDIRIDCAGPELSEYITARNSNQNLIGGLFPADPFTNIEDGYGVFTNKLHATKLGMNWHADVFEYMRFGEVTQNLGFRSTGCN